MGYRGWKRLHIHSENGSCPSAGPRRRLGPSATVLAPLCLKHYIFAQLIVMPVGSPCRHTIATLVEVRDCWDLDVQKNAAIGLESVSVCGQGSP